MKTFVLIVSKQFPITHNKSGESTGFVENIKMLSSSKSKKIHTLRANYPLWKRRAKEINEGRAVLSIRYWSEKPYRSEQVEICKLNKLGVESLDEPNNLQVALVEGVIVDWKDISINDGLSFEDFSEWFKSRQQEPMAILHFTDFRYSK